MKKNRLKEALFFLLSVAVVALGQPARTGWLGVFAATIGFMLFLASLSADLSKRRRFIISTVWFTAVQLIQLSWMTSIEFQGYYILFIYFFLCLAMGLQFGFLTLLIPVAERIPAMRLLAIAALWTLFEWARLFLMCGFTWTPVGLALAGNVYSLQFASLFGIFGLSFWVILTNLSALNVWNSKRRVKPAVAWLCVAGAPYLFGAAQLAYHLPKSHPQEQTMHAALVQTNLLPSEKIPYPLRTHEHISAFIQWDEIIRQLKNYFSKKWELIVLPEAALPFPSDHMVYPLDAVRGLLINRLGTGVLPYFPPLRAPYAEEKEAGNYVSNLFWCQTLCNYFKAEFLVGLDHVDKTNKKNYNSAFYLQPGNGDIQRYDKRVLLPMAEYLPWDILKSFSQRYGIFDFFTPGQRAKVFEIPGKVPGKAMRKKIFSPSICYEETFSGIMREGRVRGADLFVNMTNDNYYPASSLHEQHLSHATLRAVENGIPLIRSCNSGVSAAIDCFGRVIARAQNSKSVVVDCKLNTYSFSTLYTFLGDRCLIAACFFLLAAELLKKYFINLFCRRPKSP
jgi:apolipoprotein N-acyltransferase